jgi:hypothetical protein
MIRTSHLRVREYQSRMPSCSSICCCLFIFNIYIFNYIDPVFFNVEHLCNLIIITPSKKYCRNSAGISPAVNIMSSTLKNHLFIYHSTVSQEPRELARSSFPEATTYTTRCSYSYVTSTNAISIDRASNFSLPRRKSSITLSLLTFRRCLCFLKRASRGTDGQPHLRQRQ